MKAYASDIAGVIANASASVVHGTLHPIFVEQMRLAKLSADRYLTESARVHAPVTDLRLRRDESSAEMLSLSVQALAEADVDLGQAIRERGWCESGDLVTARLFEKLGIEGSAGERDKYSLGKHDSLSLFASMSRYVNVFGSWTDAAEIASFVATHQHAFDGDDKRFSIFGLAGTVLGLERAAGSDELLSAAADQHPSPFEAFFWGLRWASITAKRRGDITKSASIIERSLAAVHSHVEPSYDRNVLEGMGLNFKALLALRSKNISMASELADRSIALFGDDPRKAANLPVDEVARYTWMARLNRVQLLMFAEDHAKARSQLDELLDFARRHDRGAVHTTLSTYAYSLLAANDARGARPLLLESLDLLRVEYDPGVVTQVRKMLYLAYSMMDMPSSATRVAADSRYYWRGPSARERYEL